MQRADFSGHRANREEVLVDWRLASCERANRLLIVPIEQPIHGYELWARTVAGNGIDIRLMAAGVGRPGSTQPTDGDLLDVRRHRVPIGFVVRRGGTHEAAPGRNRDDAGQSHLA